MAAGETTTVIAMIATPAEAADPPDLAAACPAVVVAAVVAAAVVAAVVAVANAAHPLGICTRGARACPSREVDGLPLGVHVGHQFAVAVVGQGIAFVHTAAVDHPFLGL